MKQNKSWKQFDIYGQLLMLVPLIFLVTADRKTYAFAAYFSVGGWQSLSCLITFLAHPKPESPGRKRYRKMLLSIYVVFFSGVILGLFQRGDARATPLLNAISTFGIGVSFIIALGLLFLSPFMAIWYYQICVAELNALQDAQQQPVADSKIFDGSNQQTAS